MARTSSTVIMVLRLLLVILGTATYSSVLLARSSSGAVVVSAEGPRQVVESRTWRRGLANSNADAASYSSTVRGSRRHRRLGKDKEVDSGVGGGGGQPPPPTTTTSEPSIAPIPAPAPVDDPAAPAPAPTKKPSSGGGGTTNNGGGSSSSGNNGTETPPATNATSDEGGTEAPIAVDLLEFTVTYDATNSTTPEEVVASINATLFDGFQEAFPTLSSVLVEEPDSKRWRVLRLRHEPQQEHQQQHQKSSQWRHLVSAELTLGGLALFEGTAPESSEVQALQTSLLQQWQGGTVSVAAVAAQAPDGGGSSSSSSASEGASNAGLIGGIVAAVAVVVLFGAVVANRYGRRRRIQQERGNGNVSGSGGVQVEILSEVRGDEDDGDEWGTLKAGRTQSTEHADCDIEIEDRNGDVTVTTSPTGGSKRERKTADSQPPAEPHPDSVYLDEVATAASDSVDSREDRVALGSLLKFFKAQSDCCPQKSQAPEAEPAVKIVEDSEEKKEDDADEAPRSPKQMLPPSIAPVEPPSGTAIPAILPAPSGDSMDDYSLASTSFGPKIPALPATKWMEAAASPAREEYHSDNESQFTYGDVASPSVASGPTFPPLTAGNLLGPSTRKYRALSSDDDNDSIDAIMGASVNAASTSPPPASRTPTRPQKPTSKASPTSILSPLSATGSPASTASSSMSTSPIPKKGLTTKKPKQLWPGGDDAQPFDEVLEDEHDLEGFTAELERSQSRFAHPEFSPPRTSVGRQGDPPAPMAGQSVTSAAAAPSRQQGQPLRGTGSFSSATGGQEETLSSYLRTKRGEAREQRTFL